MDTLWNEGFRPPRFPSLQEDLHTDVLIIGGGMAGMLCAWLLRQQGVSCALAEARRIGSGVTGRTTAKLTAQHGLIYSKLPKEQARLYLQANLEALEAFFGLCPGMDCDFQEEDSFLYAPPGDDSAFREYQALLALDYLAEWVARPPLPFATAGAVKFPRQAQFHPLKFLYALSGGLPIYENTPVRELAPHRAVTDRGSITADKIIVATHFPILNKHGSFFLKLYQQRSYVLALKTQAGPEGMYIGTEENSISLRRQGDFLLLGGGGHRTGKTGGGWRELEAFARRHYPDGEIRYRWATQDCISLDGMPYIGPYSRRTGDLYVATGFNKWGMTGSMVAARLLTDRITQRKNRYGNLFSPSRSILKPQLGLNALETTKNLITPTVPRCPHLGCALKWNAQEHSWDCPCHGSRFSRDGHLLDNPATGNLKAPKMKNPEIY